ncbi:MAG: hypothetical protein A3B74_00050 [Candidatus Kerfeldbacteria bacterium RIFCSPHIGHO2_02_FULL_42_14]|uniref:Uncharacterized protein n=1 Tax=Candidatus Kerfeldbacteria bacterium RIFCSPHIGHO2_02_FULL_42_14 TaxID=1798540 RepID=A0A1G2AQQ0_9BACT|nr:MAG: hypothetical protein A3B74_00050 [Candidatus Kerfeldbacteria bacterium RIFCSPHIGHO2_02_FULL_42_14]OGY81331.1 MAG: hypothetical protein A3E60_02690 [Candidatus Kerfeldbacteria bacterium RIFCSPHIGHO2_12_FULL_42_13]OGY83605.1 MAG: hypothetical protein A3I91_03120 [Candidatus Kerfeldbacteria bacterium RIFCSPLOWO2_02_FULL_42_19]OGY86681.1 MAG: hypothetical protein A3G01_00505 [Candidatus Kerfeldbacteria bacterium RIFCSPLOWO2_12_FULL_43_9]
MILFHRIIPIFSTLAILILWESALVYDARYPIFFGVIMTCVFLSLAQLFHWNILSRQFIGFIVTPFLLTLGIGSFLLFLEDAWLRQLVIGLHVVSLGLFLESCFAYLHDPKGYQPYALQNVTGYMHLITLWSVLSSSYAVVLYFQMSAWIVVVPLIFFVLVILLTTLWMNKIAIRKNILFLGVNLLLFVQFFLAMQYLPLSWLVNGLVLVGVYYIVFNISRYHLMHSLNARVLHRYVFFGVTLIFGVLLTARWL